MARGQVDADYWDEVRRIEAGALDWMGQPYSVIAEKGRVLRDEGLLKAAMSAQFTTSTPNPVWRNPPNALAIAAEQAVRERKRLAPEGTISERDMRELIELQIQMNQMREAQANQQTYQNLMGLAQASGVGIGQLKGSLLGFLKGRN